MPQLPFRWEVEKVLDSSGASPIGAVTAFAGATAPSGWLLCDGTAVDRKTYADLFAVIGTTYGTGDGSTTFNVPNLKGKVPVGQDTTDTDFDVLGETRGAKTTALAATDIPTLTGIVSNESAHTHANTAAGSAHAHGNTAAGSAHSHAMSGTPGRYIVNDGGGTAYMGNNTIAGAIGPYNSVDATNTEASHAHGTSNESTHTHATNAGSAHTHTVTTPAATTNPSVLQPSLVLNFIIRF